MQTKLRIYKCLRRIKVRKMQIRKAVSPVISAVILVAVAITVAVAIAIWMGGITGQYTKFEKVEIQSGVCLKQGAVGSEYWNITLTLKNSGTATSTLIGCFINEVEVDAYNTSVAVDQQAITTMSETYSIESGVTKYISILVDYNNYYNMTSGTNVNIKIHSAGGMDYIKLIELI
jgi:flagellin-like protein